MKRLLFMSMLVLNACASAPKPQGYALPPAMSEVFRNGELAPLQKNDSLELGMPAPYDLVSHTCVSTPIYDIDGRFVRTSVRCW